MFPCIIFAAYPLCVFAFDASNGMFELTQKAMLSFSQGKNLRSYKLAVIYLLPFYLLHLPSTVLFILVPCILYLLLGNFSAASFFCLAGCLILSPFIPLALSFPTSKILNGLEKRKRSLVKAAAALVSLCGIFVYDLPFILSAKELFRFYGFLEIFIFPARFFGRAVFGNLEFFVLFALTAIAFALLLFVSSLRSAEKIQNSKSD